MFLNENKKNKTIHQETASEQISTCPLGKTRKSERERVKKALSEEGEPTLFYLVVGCSVLQIKEGREI